MTHIDEPARLQSYRAAVAAAQKGEPLVFGATEEVRMHMLDFLLEHRGTMRTAEESARYLANRPTIAKEMSELAEILEDRVSLSADVYPVAEWPLALHRHYTRREILAAVGFVKPGGARTIVQGGIYQMPETKREILFVTLDKSSSGFSPTTRYRDYAIAPDLFHWETQNAASAARPSGRRYLESPANGWSFYLFVRPKPDAAYAFLGPVLYQSHTGDRPIAITWRLQYGMPAVLFDAYATLAAL